MGWCQTEKEERPSTPGGGFRSGQSEPVPACARPSGGWVRRGTAPPATVWAQAQLHCSVSLLLKCCPGLRLRAREGCAHHRDAGSCRAQPPASPGLLQSWVCGNIQASSRGLASPDVPEPPTPATLPLPDSHCFVTPLFTSYIFTQMWFSVFFPRHILHGRMLSVRWGPNCQIMVAKTCYFGFKLVQSRRHFPLLVKKKKNKNKNLLQQPRGQQRQGAEASVARPAACEGDPTPVSLLVRVAEVTGSSVAGDSKVGQGGGAGLARVGGEGHGQRVAWDQLPPGGSLPCPVLPQTLLPEHCRHTCPAGTGIPNGDKLGAPGKQGGNRSVWAISLLIKSWSPGSTWNQLGRGIEFWEQVLTGCKSHVGHFRKRFRR